MSGLDRITEELLDKYLKHRFKEMRPKEEIENEWFVYTKSVAVPNMKKR